jgi:hypothetical protein
MIQITAGDVYSLIIECHGVAPTIVILDSLVDDGVVCDGPIELLRVAVEVMNGKLPVLDKDRVTILGILTAPDCVLLAPFVRKLLLEFLSSGMEEIQHAADAGYSKVFVDEALGEIIVAGKGVISTKAVLDMMIHAHLKNLPLWGLAHEVHLASVFLPDPLTEEDDVDRVVEFLQDSDIMSNDFDLEYGDLVHLLTKTLGIKGCLNRLRLVERSGRGCSSFAELEAGMEGVQLPTKATRQLLAKELEAIHLECPEEELDELLLVGGSVDEVVDHLKTLQALDKLPKSGNQLAEALEGILNSERHKKERNGPQEPYVRGTISRGQTIKIHHSE